MLQILWLSVSSHFLKHPMSVFILQSKYWHIIFTLRKKRWKPNLVSFAAFFNSPPLKMTLWASTANFCSLIYFRNGLTSLLLHKVQKSSWKETLGFSLVGNQHHMGDRSIKQQAMTLNSGALPSQFIRRRWNKCKESSPFTWQTSWVSQHKTSGRVVLVHVPYLPALLLLLQAASAVSWLGMPFSPAMSSCIQIFQTPDLQRVWAPNSPPDTFLSGTPPAPYR